MLNDVLRLLNNRFYIDNYGVKWSVDDYGACLFLDLGALPAIRRGNKERTEVEGIEEENGEKREGKLEKREKEGNGGKRSKREEKMWKEKLERIREENKKYLFNKKDLNDSGIKFRKEEEGEGDGPGEEIGTLKWKRKRERREREKAKGEIGSYLFRGKKEKKVRFR